MGEKKSGKNSRLPNWLQFYPPAGQETDGLNPYYMQWEPFVILLTHISNP